MQKDAHPFLKPVDVKYSKCPDYFEIIKHPMDLGTIQKKFPGKGKQALRPSDPNVYSNPYEFRDDMRLVWSNCRTYNPPHVPVRNMGEAMSDAWEKKWTVSGIESKWDEELHRQGLEEQASSPSVTEYSSHNKVYRTEGRVSKRKPSCKLFYQPNVISKFVRVAALKSCEVDIGDYAL